MRNKWMLRAFCLLAGCLTRILTSGNEIKSSLDVNKTTQHNPASAKGNFFNGSRNETVRKGSNVTLICNKSIAWKDLIYVIWNVSLQDKQCFISVAVNDKNYSTCNDGKEIVRTDTGEYVLHIPKFSTKDAGIYTCDVSFHAGGRLEKIYVSMWDVSGWLERKNGHLVAVCTATRSKPSTLIHLQAPYNTSLPAKQSVKNESGLYTVERRFYLPENVSDKNLTCVASDGAAFWKEVPISPLKPPDKLVSLPFIFLGVCATCFMVSLLTALYLMRKKLRQLSLFKKVCCKSKSSRPPTEEKLPQPRDPEEVEPYASYVQRVNSIYNSSAELFNA